MLSNAYLLAKFRFDTAENERTFAEILQNKKQLPCGARPFRPRARQRRRLRPGGERAELEKCRDCRHRRSRHLDIMYFDMTDLRCKTSVS